MLKIEIIMTVRAPEIPAHLAEGAAEKVREEIEAWRKQLKEKYPHTEMDYHFKIRGSLHD